MPVTEALKSNYDTPPPVTVDMNTFLSMTPVVESNHFLRKLHLSHGVLTVPLPVKSQR